MLILSSFLSRFEVDDAMQEWTFQDVRLFEYQSYPSHKLITFFDSQNCFDFIHGRNIASGISDWNHLASEMMR
jgi:hypothetical protein